MEEVHQPGSVLDFPHRPPWDYSMSKAELEALEERSFEAQNLFVRKVPLAITERHSTPPASAFSSQNLYTILYNWVGLTVRNYPVF